MAANNNDSKRIFDSYINQYLNILNEGPRGGSATGAEMASAENNPGDEETVSNIPGVPAIPKSGLTAKVPNPISAVGNAVAGAFTGNGNSTYDIQARNTIAARQAQGLPAVAGQQPAAGTTTANAAAPQPTAAPTPQATTAPQTATKTGEPSSEEKELFKKLHGSDYAPGVGDQRLAELRNAVQQAGNTTDVSKIANIAYSQQYKGTPQGDAYAKRAGINMMPMKPGNMQPAPAAASQGDQVAQTGQGSATQAKANTESPEYKKWYEDGKSKGFI